MRQYLVKPLHHAFLIENLNTNSRSFSIVVMLECSLEAVPCMSAQPGLHGYRCMPVAHGLEMLCCALDTQSQG